MKKIIAVMALGLGFTAANAQQIKETRVPQIVKTSFAKMLPDAKAVKWDKEKDKFEASYTNGLHKGSVLFTANGKWTERETAIAVKSLPVKAIAYMNKNFTKNQLLGAAKIVKVNGEVQYEAEIQGKDVFFTQKGELIKVEKV